MKYNQCLKQKYRELSVLTDKQVHLHICNFVVDKNIYNWYSKFKI